MPRVSSAMVAEGELFAQIEPLCNYPINNSLLALSMPAASSDYEDDNGYGADEGERGNSRPPCNKRTQTRDSNKRTPSTP